MTPDEHHTTTSSLELRVQQHLGQRLDYRWHWPAGATECRMDQVLVPLRAGEAAQQALLPGCSVQCLGPLPQTVWLLGHTQEALDCRVNQEPLRAHSQRRLCHGDQISLGATVMQVCLEPAGARPGQDPLHALHVASLEKMQAPGADVRAEWEQLVQQAHAEHTDPLQKWMAEASRQPDLAALMQPLRNMEPMLQGLQALGSKDLLAPQTFDQLLHLYAPDDQHLPVRTTVARVLQGSLPGHSPEQQALLQEQEKAREQE